MRRPILICLSLVIFKSPIIIFYAFNVFRSAGIESIDNNLSLCIVAGIQVLATILSSVLVDKIGRRVLLISSEAIMFLSLFVLGTFFHLKKSSKDQILDLVVQDLDMDMSKKIQELDNMNGSRWSA